MSGGVGPAVLPAVTDDPDGYFGERVAAAYDDDPPQPSEPAAVSFLAELAGAGRALELGVGTGRIALPLARCGVGVHGVDLSRAMLARLRAKPGGDAVAVSVGDFATVRVSDTFSLVYLVFNTIMNLTTQAAQVACFRTAAEHLAPGGSFVIEVMVPQLRRLPPGQTAVPYLTGPARFGFDLYDTATQAMSSNAVQVERDSGAARFSSIPFRYVWPSELDLMAQLAGLELRERWAGWNREAFDHESQGHVSIWGKPASPLPAPASAAPG